MKARAKRRKALKVPGVNIGFWNVRSLLSAEKQENVKVLLGRQQLDILCLAESWFRSDAKSHGLSIDGYKVYLNTKVSLLPKFMFTI